MEENETSGVADDLACGSGEELPSGSGGLGWQMLVLLARGGGHELAQGSCHACDALMAQVPSLGGTGLLRKGPKDHNTQQTHQK